MIKVICLCATLQFVTKPAAAASFLEQMIDPQDGKLDISQMLASKPRFLPVPLIISDSAVGYARSLGLRVGMDIATGPEDSVLYKAVGGRWN